MFAKRLKQLRLDTPMTQEELEKKSGVSQETISRIERGHENPQWHTVVKLAKALGVETSRFELHKSK